MKPFNSIISALWVCLATLSLTQAGPTPTRPFTVSAYESPYPVGEGLTGYNLTARHGNLYLSPKAGGEPETPFPIVQPRLIVLQSRKPFCSSRALGRHTWYVP